MVEEDDSYVVGVKVNDNSNIASLSLGYHKKITDYNEPYEFSMKDIEAHPDKYLVEEVKEGYALSWMNTHMKVGLYEVLMRKGIWLLTNCSLHSLGIRTGKEYRQLRN